ncbi:MAG: hypothetical protein CVV42_19065 [Candidatus Riflebacteria bacterium HGW-Riflebacteria-2]|nr:MAG: hypothetical protein CVV42_19065 [Candidatus Riflebacteria bacterium HGW-Riflebacteria-2]
MAEALDSKQNNELKFSAARLNVQNIVFTQWRKGDGYYLSITVTEYDKHYARSSQASAKGFKWSGFKLNEGLNLS